MRWSCGSRRRRSKAPPTRRSSGFSRDALRRPRRGRSDSQRRSRATEAGGDRRRDGRHRPPAIALVVAHGSSPGSAGRALAGPRACATLARGGRRLLHPQHIRSADVRGRRAGHRPPSRPTPVRCRAQSSPRARAPSSSWATEADWRRDGHAHRRRGRRRRGRRRRRARLRRSAHARRVRRRPPRRAAPPAGRRDLRRDRRRRRRDRQQRARHARGHRRSARGRDAPPARRDAPLRHDDVRGQERLRADDGGRAEDAAGHPALAADHDIELSPTFMGAHEVPVEYRERRRAYIDLVVSR